MYLSLIDTVTQIVKNYGVSILSDPKFWHILTDSYSFGNEYSLRDIFKSCINTGYASKLVSLRGNSKKTKAEIAHIVEAENKICPGKELEYSAVLYSIAIAIGSCNKKDYSDFINRNNPKPTPSPNSKPNSPNPKPQKNPSLGWKERISIFWIVFLGIIVSYGGTIFYSAFYNGWWLFFIVLLMGLAQVGYVAILMATLEEFNRTPHFKKVVRSIICPFLIAIIFNALMSFLFFSKTFRLWLGQHLNDYPTDEPTFITFLLCIFYVLFIGFGCLSCYNTDISQIKVSSDIDKRIFIRSSICVFLGYIILFFYPNIREGIANRNILKEQEKIEQEYLIQHNTNKKLQEKRSHQNIELSFKGVRLGMSFDTAKGIINNLSDFKGNLNGHYSIYVCEPQRVFQSIAHVYLSHSVTEQSDYDGELIEGTTNIDNQGVSFRILESNGLVFAIVVLPYASNHYNAPEGEFNNFKTLLSLYKTKYGEPEIIDKTFFEGLVPRTGNYSDCDYYAWTYKNGAIWMNHNSIVYLSSEFIKDVENKYNLEQAEIRQQELEKIERQRIEKLRQDSITRIDSLNRIRNHKNAINEI